MFWRKKPIIFEEPVEIPHVPCLYVVSYILPNGIKRDMEVIATSAKHARSEAAKQMTGPFRIVRTFREGYI